LPCDFCTHRLMDYVELANRQSVMFATVGAFKAVACAPR
jgi:hypothetical protein